MWPTCIGDDDAADSSEQEDMELESDESDGASSEVDCVTSGGEAVCAASAGEAVCVAKEVDCVTSGGEAVGVASAGETVCVATEADCVTSGGEAVCVASVGATVCVEKEVDCVTSGGDAVCVASAGGADCVASAAPAAACNISSDSDVEPVHVQDVEIGPAEAGEALERMGVSARRVLASDELWKAFVATVCDVRKVLDKGAQDAVGKQDVKKGDAEVQLQVVEVQAPVEAQPGVGANLWVPEGVQPGAHDVEVQQGAKEGAGQERTVVTLRQRRPLQQHAAGADKQETQSSWMSVT